MCANNLRIALANPRRWLMSIEKPPLVGDVLQADYFVHIVDLAGVGYPWCSERQKVTSNVE